MPSHHRKLTAAIWIVLGLLGVSAAVWDLSRIPPDKGAITADLILFFVSFGVVISSLSSWRGQRVGRYLLCAFATIVALYCIAFQLMVSLEFGWVWFVATIMLFAFSLFTLWSQTRRV